MADRFWVGDLGNWSDALNHWSASTGGAPNASKPTSADNVFFDANSFSIGSQTVTVDETANCLDMDWTGATNTPTLDFDAAARALNIYGSATFISAMAITVTSYALIGLNTTGPATLTTNGLALPFAITVSASGSITLSDALTLAGGIPRMEVAGGTINTANYDVTLDFISFVGASAKTVTLGSSTINIRGTGGDGTGSGWNYTGSNLTLTANTATIKIAGTGTFKGGGITTYNDVELNGSAHTISGSSTFSTLTLKADTTQTITFTDGTTQTITTPVLTGSAGKIKTLIGSSTGGWTITKAGGGTVQADYLALSYSAATPGQTWYTANSTDTVGNSGWIFAWIAGNILGVTVATINKINGVTLATVNKLNGVSN